MRTFRGDEADAPDPQLDPEQHRRRPGALCGPLSCNLPRREEAQTQQQSQQEPQRQALGNSSCGQRRAVRDGAWGTPALQDRGRARNAAADLASALGVPKPWTVQDQPSYAPLLLRRATGPSPLAEDAPLPSTRPYDPASGGGLACGGGGSETSCYGTRADGSDSTGEALLGSQYSVTQGGEGRTELVRGPQASLAVSTPRLSLSAAAAAILRLHEQQRQRHAALVPLWDGQSQGRVPLPPLGLGSPCYQAISQPPGSSSSSQREPHAPAAAAAAASASVGLVVAATTGTGEAVASSAATAEVLGRRQCRLVTLPAGNDDEEGQVTLRAVHGKPGLRRRTTMAVEDQAERCTPSPPRGGNHVEKWQGRARSPTAEDRRTAPLMHLASRPSPAAAGSNSRSNRCSIASSRTCGSSSSNSSSSNSSSSSSSEASVLPVLLPSPTRTAVAAVALSKTAVLSGLSFGVAGGDNGGGGGRGWGEGRESVQYQRGHNSCGNDNSSAGVGRRGPTSAVAARRLMRAITGCHHWRQLRALLQEYGDCLNALHVTAALGKLTRMQLPPPPSPSPPRVPPSLPERGSPCLSLPAGGKLAPAGEVAEVQILLSHLEIALRRHIDVAWAGSGGLADPGGGSGSGGGRGSDCSGGGGVRPGHVNAITAGSAAWIADMACEASATAAEAELYGITPRLGPRQLATSLAALARMRSVGWPVAEDRALLGAAVALSGFWQLESFPSQELTTLVYSLAKLGHHPGRTWLEAACDAAAGAAAQRHMCARQLSTFLWALATLRHQPGEAFMTAWTKAAVRAMARFSAYDISQALWALATLHRARSPPPLAAAGATAAAELLLPCATAPALPHGLPEVFVRAALGRAKAVLRSAGGGRGDCVPQDVCNILWAVSQLQLGPPRAWVTVVASALLSAPDAAIASCRPADLAGLLWALARMLPASPPPRGEMLRVVRAAARLVGQCGEQDMSNIFWALGSMRFVPPPRVMHAFGLRLLQLCVQGAAGPQLLSTALWCCVRLHVPPRPALLRQLLAAAARSAPQFDPRSAPLLLYSLARLHHLGWLPAEACQPLEPARVRQQSPQSLQHHRGRSTIAWPAWPEVAESWQRDGQAKPRSGVRADGMSAAPPPPASLLPLDLGPFLDVALGGMAEVEAEVGRPRLALPVLLWSVARLGHQPDEGWTRAYLAHTFEVLPQLSLAEACLVVSALLRLGHLPPPLWLARMEQLMARSWGPAAGREAAELRREVHSLTRRTAAAAAGAVEATDAAAPWVPAVGPAGPGPPTADGAFAEALSQGKVPKPAAVMVRREQQREFWQQRERQRRRQREVAARVLGQRLAACRARLAQLSSCMTRLRRGLAVLGAQVRQRQEGQQKGQQVRQCESQQPQAAAGASDGSAVDVAGGAA
ncbi:hypothetical protein PLESTF_000638800 [Pleodorina starrii]|nr:hypothetical protein PLESTF_000638800 [Pleodorina starrii]